MKQSKKVVDERQEQEMLRIERAGFWLLYWLLLVAMVIQMAMKDFQFRNIIGEWAVFMLGCIYVLVRFLAKGHWTYCSKPTPKTHLWQSAVAAMIFAVVWAGISLLNGSEMRRILLIAGFNFVLVFLLCFVALLIAGNIAKKRQEKLNASYEEEGLE